MASTSTAPLGECECCIRGNKAVIRRGDSAMCAECVRDEDTTRSAEARAIIEESHRIDSNIRIQPDIFSAETTSAIELKGAIDNDDSVPADQKDYAMAKECQQRMIHYRNLLSETRKMIGEYETKMKHWQVQTQEFAGNLRAELKAQFKAQDITYQPAIVKPSKAGKAVKTPKAQQMAELKESAAKYGVQIAMVSMIASTRHISPDAAGRVAAELMAAKNKKAVS